MATAVHPVGDLLREWRQRRRMSQLDLSLEADISTKHLSFLETGRSQPSRDMVLLLAEQLEIPMRERNVLLVAAGYAPVFAERRLEDPALQAARKAVDLVLAGHEPYPALAVDRHWTLIAANSAVGRLIGGADAALLQPPVNVLRLSLHPQGLAPRIANLPEWRAHLLARLRRQIEVSADPVLIELLREPPELMLVVGGYNSSNTTHLAALCASRNVRTYHIEDSDCVDPASGAAMPAWLKSAAINRSN
jgi:transcriptional regulator with XRE-family HTH domain